MGMASTELSRLIAPTMGTEALWMEFARSSTKGSLEPLHGGTPAPVVIPDQPLEDDALAPARSVRSAASEGRHPREVERSVRSLSLLVCEVTSSLTRAEHAFRIESWLSRLRCFPARS